MKHIGLKLFIGFLCMAALTVGLLWLIQAGIMKNSYVNERVDTIQTALKQASGDTSIDFAALEEKLNARFLWLDGDGNTSYVSQGMPMMGKMSRMMQLLPEANGRLQMLNSESSAVQYAVIGYPLQTGGTLYAVFSLADAQEAERLLQKQLWMITAALIAFSIVIAVFLARKFSRPIRDLTGAAHHLASGNLDIDLPVKSKDELGQLTEALNDLGHQLKVTENLRKELIANVSHELRAPIAVIQGYAETVRDVTWTNEKKRTEQLTIIADEAARLSRMVTAMLDYSRLQAGVEKPAVSDFPVIPVLEKIIKLHELEASGRDIKIKLNSPDISVRFDQNRFEQVVHNFLINAVSHASSGTDIVIKAEKTSSAARISVKNQGMQIPEDQLDKIWDRYYRGKNQNTGLTSGTGFGLAIVKSIADLHSTECGVQSGPDDTVFWFETQKI